MTEHIPTPNLCSQPKDTTFNTNLLDVAQNMISEGFSVIPILPDKSPSVKWESYKRVLMIENEIGDKFKNAIRIGIICGEVSGWYHLVYCYNSDIARQRSNIPTLTTKIKKIMK